MGTSRTPTEFVGKINKIGQATDRHRREAVNAGAFLAKKTMLAAAGSAGLGVGSKIAGKSWNVGYDIKGRERPVALVRYKGPVHLVNNPTKAHYIAAAGLGGNRQGRADRAFQASAARFQGGSARGAFAGSRRSSRGKRSLKFGSSNYAYVHHPGTTGKRFFTAAKTIASRTVPDEMARSMKGAWKRALT